MIYLDDITVFSKSDLDHLRHLRKVFLKCRKFGISFNPKKSHFAMEEGKLLGHIILEKGIKIDLDRVVAIKQIGLPRNKKEIQSFLGKVNFLRRFITNFAEVVKYINSMLKKTNNFQWSKEAKQSFLSIKQALSEAPVLVSPNFGKDFMIFSFASEHTIAGVLLQKNQQNEEQPIAFYSKALRDSTLKYNIMEKQAYACVKALKEFKVYILHSQSIVFVPSTTIKNILTQAKPDGRRDKWIATLLEYDIEIRPNKLVKGQGLAKLMTQSNHEALGINFLKPCTYIIAQQEEGQVHPDFLASSW